MAWVKYFRSLSEAETGVQSITSQKQEISVCLGFLCSINSISVT